MKGIMLIVMLLALLVTGYLLLQDMKARQEQGSSNIEAIEKANRLGEKVDKAGEDQERRLNKILGD